MPTGYTAEIPNGISFEKFAITCAGAFLYSTWRTLSVGHDIPAVFEPDMYHFHEMIRAVRRLEELQAMSDEEAEAAATKEWEEREIRRIKRLQECIDARAAYSAMLAKVDNWVPTEQYRELKRFMRREIEASVEADCLEEFYRSVTPRLSGVSWRTLRMAEKHEEVESEKKQHQKEVERAEHVTNWMRALRESIDVQSNLV